MLDNITIKADNKFYKQLRGVGTGYHSSVAYSEILVDETLHDCIEDSTPISGLSVYVDDSWALWDGTNEQLTGFVNRLNACWPGLTFVLTPEQEDWSIVFLDLRITRLPSSLKTSFYRKETHSGTYLHFSSHCPIIQKMNIVKNETRRIIANCSHRPDADPHLSGLRSNLLNSGYPPDFIDKYMANAMSTDPVGQQRDQPDNNLPMVSIPYVSEAFTRIFKKELKRNNIDARVVVKGAGTLKQKYHKPLGSHCDCTVCDLGTPCKIRHVIYRADCKHCSEGYVGVTTRPFITRYKEHEASIRLGNTKSALSTHLSGDFDHPPCQNPTNTIQGFSWKIVDRAKSYKDSFIREGVVINSTGPKINRNTPGWVSYIKL